MCTRPLAWRLLVISVNRPSQMTSLEICKDTAVPHFRIWSPQQNASGQWFDDATKGSRQLRRVTLEDALAPEALS